MRLRLELTFGNGEELAAHVGEVDALRRAGEELYAIGGLELLDVVGNGGLGEAQALGGARKTAVNGYRMKGFEAGKMTA